MSNVTGELRNWVYDYMVNRYIGDIYCDQKRRWIDGKRISTSLVVAVVDKGECLYVVTLSSTYRLNKNQMGSTLDSQIRQSSQYSRVTDARKDAEADHV